MSHDTDGSAMGKRCQQLHWGGGLPILNGNNDMKCGETSSPPSWEQDSTLSFGLETNHACVYFYNFKSVSTLTDDYVHKN